MKTHPVTLSTKIFEIEHCSRLYSRMSTKPALCGYTQQKCNAAACIHEIWITKVIFQKTKFSRSLLSLCKLMRLFALHKLSTNSSCPKRYVAECWEPPLQSKHCMKRPEKIQQTRLSIHENTDAQTSKCHVNIDTKFQKTRGVGQVKTTDRHHKKRLLIKQNLCWTNWKFRQIANVGSCDVTRYLRLFNDKKQLFSQRCTCAGWCKIINCKWFFSKIAKVICTTLYEIGYCACLCLHLVQNGRWYYILELIQARKGSPARNPLSRCSLQASEENTKSQTFAKQAFLLDLIALVSGFLIPLVEDFVEKKLLEHFKFVRKKGEDCGSGAHTGKHRRHVW